MARQLSFEEQMAAARSLHDDFVANKGGKQQLPRTSGKQQVQYNYAVQDKSHGRENIPITQSGNNRKSKGYVPPSSLTRAGLKPTKANPLPRPDRDPRIVDATVLKIWGEFGRTGAIPNPLPSGVNRANIEWLNTPSTAPPRPQNVERNVPQDLPASTPTVPESMPSGDLRDSDEVTMGSEDMAEFMTGLSDDDEDLYGISDVEEEDNNFHNIPSLLDVATKVIPNFKCLVPSNVNCSCPGADFPVDGPKAAENMQKRQQAEEIVQMMVEGLVQEEEAVGAITLQTQKTLARPVHPAFFPNDPRPQKADGPKGSVERPIPKPQHSYVAELRQVISSDTAFFTGSAQYRAAEDSVPDTDTRTYHGSLVASKPVAPKTVAPNMVNLKTAVPDVVAPKPVAPNTVALKPVAQKPVAPKTAVPDVVALKPVAPNMVTPKTAVPDVVAPKTAVPDVVTLKPVTPKTIAPNMMTPKTAVPDVVAPQQVANVPAVPTPSPVAAPKKIVKGLAASRWA